MSDSAWVIEKPSVAAAEPTWWDGIGFSFDDQEAVRFARQADAEKVIAYFREQDGLWMGALYVGVRSARKWWPDERLAALAGDYQPPRRSA